MLIPPYYAASGGEYTQKRFNKDDNTLSLFTVTSGIKTIIELSVSKLDLDMTKYFLELSMKLPQVNTVILKDSETTQTGKDFFEKLIEYYQNKCKTYTMFDIMPMN
ncbi:hypothetical protein [Rickettsia endosymbiont of Gonocerus acuteangulatus]|uniref:hypothetical protein n=1 Tax=Rickettsia endosymbiont of Gonocerus acuteangulatus TaxID=3066266 RepID=UPI0031335288